MVCSFIQVEGATFPTKSGVLLLEGWNEVTEDEFLCLLPSIAPHIADGRIEFYGKQEEGVVSTKPLNEVRADIAVKIIKGTYNPFTLEAWANNPELTPDLRFHVDKQLEAVRQGEDPIGPRS